MSWVVSEALIPILSSGFPTCNPGILFGQTNAEILREGLSLLPVTANRIATSHDFPDVIHVFVPLMTYTSPRLTAVVLIAAGFDPACASERAYAPSHCPDASSGRKRA